MSEFVLMTDSSCDLPENLANEMDLTVLPLSYTQNGETMQNRLSASAGEIRRFYQRLREGIGAVTTGVNFDAAYTAMENVLQKGKDVLCLAFSSALSCTYASFHSAAKELREKYRDRKIYVVDTRSASLGQGLLVYLTAAQKKIGLSIDAVRDFAEKTKLKVCHLFTVDDLMHLRRGGRISTAAAFVGSMLSVKPIMHMDDEGRLIPLFNVRGRKRSISTLAELMSQQVENAEEQTVFISHGDCEEDAKTLADMIREKLHVKSFVTHFVGPVIGAHSGPGTLALFFVGKHR